MINWGPLVCGALHKVRYDSDIVIKQIKGRNCFKPARSIFKLNFETKFSSFNILKGALYMSKLLNLKHITLVCMYTYAFILTKYGTC